MTAGRTDHTKFAAPAHVPAPADRRPAGPVAFLGPEPVEPITLTAEKLFAIVTWAWWEGCEAGRGNGAPPSLEDVLLQLE